MGANAAGNKKHYIESKEISQLWGLQIAKPFVLKKLPSHVKNFAYLNTFKFFIG